MTTKCVIKNFWVFKHKSSLSVISCDFLIFNIHFTFHGVQVMIFYLCVVDIN